MLNWIVIWVGTYLFGIGGPAPDDQANADSRLEDDRRRGAEAGRVSGATRSSRGSTSASSSRSRRSSSTRSCSTARPSGYEVRAVGHNPEAARYGGISVARNYFLAMAIAGHVRGARRRARRPRLEVPARLDADSGSTIGFIGIAVALLGRNTAVGVGLAALLFAALQTGTSSRNLDPEIFPPELASRLAIIIQGLIVLFVGADVVVLVLLARLRGRRRRGARRREDSPRRAAAWLAGRRLGRGHRRDRRLPSSRCLRSRSGAPSLPWSSGSSRSRSESARGSAASAGSAPTRSRPGCRAS